MSELKELAEELYSKIFLPGDNLSGNFEEVYKVIMRFTSILKDDPEKYKLLTFLGGLIYERNIVEIENQRRKYGLIIKAKYEEISLLYHWIQKVILTAANGHNFEPLPNVAAESIVHNSEGLTISRDITSFTWKGTANQLKSLRELLVENDFVDKATTLKTFEQAFGLLSFIESKIIWVKISRNKRLNKKAIFQLIYSLVKYEFIPKEEIKDLTKLKNRIKSTFTSLYEANLRLENDNVPNNNRPSALEKQLDLIIDQIKAN